PGTDYYGVFLSALDAILGHRYALDALEGEQQLDEIHRGLSGDLLHDSAECFLHILTKGHAIDRQTAQVDLDPLAGLKHLRISSGTPRSPSWSDRDPPPLRSAQPVTSTSILGCQLFRDVLAVKTVSCGVTFSLPQLGRGSLFLAVTGSTSLAF